METAQLVFCVAFTAVAILIVSAFIRDRLRRRGRLRAWKHRPAQDDTNFGLRFSPNDPARAEVAIRVRKVLAANLEIPLERLQPADRLNEDLGTELAANPHLFWELETEFEIKTDVEELESHEKTLQKLVTFADLVDYITARVRERPPAPEPEQPSPATFAAKLYDGAIRSIPILCVTGFVVIVAGILIQKSIVTKLGTGLFLAGFAVWGLANGGGFAWGLFLAIREKGLKELAAHPWTTLILTLLAAFFLIVGGFFVWAVAKALMSSN